MYCGVIISLCGLYVSMIAFKIPVQHVRLNMFACSTHACDQISSYVKILRYAAIGLVLFSMCISMTNMRRTSGWSVIGVSALAGLLYAGAVKVGRYSDIFVEHRFSHQDND